MLESFRPGGNARGGTRDGGTKRHLSLGLVLMTAAILSCAFERQSRPGGELVLDRASGRIGRVTVYVDPRAPVVRIDGQRQPLPLVDAVLAYGKDAPSFAAPADLIIAGAAELFWHIQVSSELRWAQWELSIFDESGIEVWRVQGLGRPPSRIPWYLDVGGEPLRPGVYRYRIAASTAAGDLGEGRWRRVRSVPVRSTRANPAGRRGVRDGGRGIGEGDGDNRRRDGAESDRGAAPEDPTLLYPGFVVVEGTPAPADAPSETRVAMRRGAPLVIDLRERAGRRVRLLRSHPFEPAPLGLGPELDAAGSLAGGRTIADQSASAEGGLIRSAAVGIPRAGAPPGRPHLGSGPGVLSATTPEGRAAQTTRRPVRRQDWLERAALFAAADPPSFADSFTANAGVDAISGYAARMPDKRLSASGRPPLGEPSGPAPLASPSGPAPILPPSGPRPRRFPPSGPPPPRGVEVIWLWPSLVPQA